MYAIYRIESRARVWSVTLPTNRWSSYRSNAGMEGIDWLQPHQEYLRLGSNKDLRTAAYRELFKAAIDADDIRAIRLHVNRDCVLGGERFQAAIAEMLGRRAHVARVGQPKGTTRLAEM